MSSVITDPFRQKLLLSAVALGVVMDGIDGSIVNVALPTMATYFDTDTGTIAWVIITYLLMMAGLSVVLASMPFLGRRSLGAEVGQLHTKGIYRFISPLISTSGLACSLLLSSNLDCFCFLRTRSNPPLPESPRKRFYHLANGCCR